MSWFYNLLIGLGGVIIGMLAFADDISKKVSLLEFSRSLLFKIPLFITASFLIIFGSIQKDNDTEAESDGKERELKNQLSASDSAQKVERQISDSIYTVKLQEKLDSSYEKSIRASNQALAQYNLILIDSLHTVTTRINSKSVDLPQLSIAPFIPRSSPPVYLDSSNNEAYFKVKFTSENNIAFNINIKYYLLICRLAQKRELLTDWNFVDTGYLFWQEAYLVQNRFRTRGFILKPQYQNLDCLMVFMQGTFSSDRQNKNKIPFREAVYFNTKLNQFQGTATTEIIQGVYDQLERRNFIK